MKKSGFHYNFADNDAEAQSSDVIFTLHLCLGCYGHRNAFDRSVSILRVLGYRPIDLKQQTKDSVVIMLFLVEIFLIDITVLRNLKCNMFPKKLKRLKKTLIEVGFIFQVARIFCWISTLALFQTHTGIAASGSRYHHSQTCAAPSFY